MKQKLLIIIVHIIFINASAQQIDTNEKTIVDYSYTTTNTSLSVSVDVNGDGYSDIIASGSDLNWYENLDGLGGFSSKNLISLNVNARAIQVADFDGDGDQDVIILGSNKPISIYENIDGKGTFELNQNLGSSSNSTIFLSDIDNDGDIDIVSSYTNSFPTKTKIIFYENIDGKGDYSVEQVITTYDTLKFIKALYVVDIDGDNDMDLITAFYNDDTLSWFEHLDDNHNFSPEKIITTLVDGVLSIVSTDIDNDGDMDIVSGSEKDNKIAWYENIDGKGIFSEQKIISSNMINVQSIHIADIDNDGDIDVLSAASTPTSAFQASIDNKIALFENTDGKGIFGQEQIISTKAIGAKSVIADDLNGDGYIDVISASKDDDKVAWYKNTNAPNRFEDARIITRQVKNPSVIYAGDFDGDNDLDVLSLSQHDAEVAWYENTDGKGFFGNQRIITEKIGTGNSRPTAFPVDIDGDGDLDIPVGKRNELSWYENIDGKGDFSIQHIFSNEAGAPNITRVSDVDNDGDIDLIFGYYNDKIVWYENTDGKGSFSTPQIISEAAARGGSLISMQISDIDGDNDDDIIAVSFNVATIKWYENTDGKGTFSLHGFSANETGAIYPADMDGDNDIDIVAVSKNGERNNSVSWYENMDSKGYFSTEHIVSTVRIHGNSIYATDLDSDGDIDVLTASGHPVTHGRLAWYENLDNGKEFSEQQIISEVNTPRVGQHVYVADIDSDKDMDILFTHAYAPNDSAGKIAWFENIGTDQDNDGITNDNDLCPNTPIGETVNANGCSVNQLADDDNDGVVNNIDRCADTPVGETVNTIGCGESQLDQDNDGITNDKDLCPNTPVYDNVNADGCGESQLDDDNDGVSNEYDLCANTPNGETVDYDGCAESQLDNDSDGVMNDVDLCANTPNGETVNTDGCAESQLDDDSDGVINGIDLCPNTPNGETVNTDGCAESQLDDDNDGATNDIDVCANTPNGETVNTDGCSESQLDDDNDGINNNIDQCANTPLNTAVDIKGCILFPENNLTIQTIGETCPNKNNAKIIISANENYNYTASLNATDYNFTTDLIIDNLTSGNHELCITIPSEFYEQCYTIALPEGKTISGKLSSGKSGEVSITIEKGTAPYSVFVNGHVVSQTESSSFSVNASHGDIVEIATSKVCEGKLSKKMDLIGEIVAYPNPTSGAIEINLPTTQKEVIIELYTIQSQLIARHRYQLENEKVILNFKKQPKGIYFAKVLMKEPVLLKIIKK